ncbi:MAG: PQQ-dependent sugar dehydrogenase, partial [Anaerolineae bacterium]|nr:PQQ-dependent sugar dehydrogenase [Phycisphaerae bacterium]
MSASRTELVQPPRRAPVLSEILESRTLLSTVPDGFTDTTVAGGLFSPTSMDLAPDGSGRIFVTEQTGKVRVIKDGQLITQPFATLSVTSFGEHGLLGITFDPDFANNQFVYVYYTTAGTQFHNRLSRFTANGDVAAGGETVLFDSDDLDSTQLFHDGGGLHFGPDGKIYISTGENQHPENSQLLSNLQGKLLRLNSDGTIPSDNPFFNSATGKNRAIYAYGFRNPFTYAFQPGTGLLYVNDVGNDLFEEINQVSAGGNFGWPQQEGSNGAGQNGITDSIFFYDHGVGNAITGGVFYPNSGSFPAPYLGKYFFADIGGGWIHILDPATKQQTDFATGLLAPVDLDLGDDGSLYYLGRLSDSDVQQATGFVSVIRNASQQAPQITTNPANKTVAKTAPVTFTVQAT